MKTLNFNFSSLVKHLVNIKNLKIQIIALTTPFSAYKTSFSRYYQFYSHFCLIILGT